MPATIARPQKRRRTAQPRTPQRSHAPPAAANAQATGLTIPLLTGVDHVRSNRALDKTCAKLAATLIRADLLDPPSLPLKNPFDLVQDGFAELTKSYIARSGHTPETFLFAILNRHKTDTGRRYYAIEVESVDQAWATCMGPTLDALTAAGDERLAATFYHLLTESIQKWWPIFDHAEAAIHFDMVTEWNQESEDGEQTEAPTIELPNCLKGPRLTIAETHAAAQSLTDPNLQSLVSDVLRLQEIAARPGRNDIEESDHDGYYESDPLPLLVVYFEQNDPISHYFDMWGQDALQVSHRPATTFHFDPNKPASVIDAFRRYADLCEGTALTVSIADRLLDPPASTNR